MKVALHLLKLFAYERKLNIIVFFFLLPGYSLIFAQANEVVENVSLYHPEFKHLDQTIGTPIVMDDASIIYNANAHLIKHRKSGELEWIRHIPKFSASFSNPPGEIVGAFLSHPLLPDGTNRGGIATLSADGSVRWSKEIYSSERALSYAASGKLTAGKNSDIILTNYTCGEIAILVFNQEMTRINLNRHFRVPLSADQYVQSVDVAVAGNSIFMLCTLLESSFYFDKNDLLIIRLNYQTGAIEKKKLIHLNDKLSIPVSPYINSILDGVVDAHLTLRTIGERDMMVAFRKATHHLDNNRMFALKIDTELNIGKYVVYTAENHSYLRRNYLTIRPAVNEKVVFYSAISGIMVLII